nr:hypothetical protein [Tanacetum cinerariifolium]
DRHRPGRARRFRPAAAGGAGPRSAAARAASRHAADSRQHLAGVRCGAAGAGPDHVAPEPGSGADLRPAGRRPHRCRGAGRRPSACPAKPEAF